MHTIHNIAFEVDVNHNDGLVSWEQYYVDFFQNRLLPRVESICDNWDKKYPNTKCAIDSIDINVEVDDLNLETLQKEIIHQISQQLINIQSDGTSSDGKIIARITPEASPFDALLRYLSDGILEAYIPVKSFKEWLNTSEFTSTEKTKLKTLFIQSSDAIERMLSLLRNDHTAFSALIETKQQFTTQHITLETTFFKQFIKAIFEGFQLYYDNSVASIWHKTLGVSSSITQFSKTFLQLLQPKVQSEGKRITKSNERYISIALLQAIVQHEAGKNITISVSKIGTVVNETSKNQRDTTKDVLTQKKDSQQSTKDLIDATSDNQLVDEIEDEAEIENLQTEKDKTEKHQTNEKVSDTIKKESEKAITENRNVHEKTAADLENTTANDTESFLAKAKTPKTLKDVALTTEKSGLILLHPFLTTFLKGADLVTENNEIKDIDKACMLLHYLATENEEVTDVELTLEKIMLGIPLETIIDYQTPLTTEDKALCDELLNAVLTHWVVLKKSTINTLRDMFIKRDGYITITEESIKLKIEHMAQDILLEKVPWNISLFRLKWMEKMVHIEW
ncbi:hypothetical protein IMCC3317_08290 [Kordia antarctica]|uniref:Uncharacterized protein n=1 Tax=Kordia antarctica TaxID=1218801 RepID=A0A7L4ZFN1_9FLAO|nr:contractile injection system tape measure protein [Kordia antarctica]QHI35483.1 hypothetical protein IMCC3317_08290 [Kordia antarctica]